MENTNFSPEHLEPTNGEENINLQNNSEENTKNENVERQTPKHFSGLSDIIPEEEERRMQDDDRELWERMNEEDETNSAGSEEENVERTNDKDPGKDDEKTDVGEQLNQSTVRRHYKKDNLQIAGLKRIKDQKVRKDKRLGDEIDSLKSDLARGYLIVQLVEDSEKMKHVQLDVSDKEMIKSAIAEKEYEKYELGLDIGEIDMKIRTLASAKKSSFQNKLSKKKQDKNENDMVKRINSALDKASKNGSKEIVSKIKQQVQSGKKDDAYDSLKSFLSQQVKPVAKKLDKDSKLEKNVLDRVIDKLSSSQS